MAWLKKKPGWVFSAWAKVTAKEQQKQAEPMIWKSVPTGEHSC